MSSINYLNCMFFLGVSNQTLYPTHPPNLADPAWEPAVPMPVRVGNRSPIPKSETRGSVDKLEHGKPISTDPTEKHTRNSFLHRLKYFAGMILSDLSRSGEISSRSGLISSRSRRDLARSLRDRAWSCWDLPRSLQVRPNLVEISQDLFEIRSDPAKISRFWQKSGTIRTIRAQLENFDVRPPKPLSSAGRRRIHF